MYQACQLVMWYPSVAYTRIPHHQQTSALHNTSTPQLTLHNTSIRQLLKMDVLTTETCSAVYNKASVIQLVNLYSKTNKEVHICIEVFRVTISLRGCGYANTIKHNLELCPTPEQNNRVSFLDLAFVRNTPVSEINIFRIPTTTDTTLSYLFNHLQKLAAYRFLIDRMLNLTLHKNHLENE